MNYLEEFLQNGPKGEGILSAEEVPYRVPLLLNNVEKLEESKYKSFVMQATVIGSKAGKKWSYANNWRKKYNIDEKIGEFEQKIAEADKELKLTLPDSKPSKRQKFTFYLPKRLSQLCEDPAALEGINSKSLLGMFVGRIKNSLSIVMVPLDKTSGKSREELSDKMLSRNKRTEDEEEPVAKKGRSDKGESEEVLSSESSDEA